MSVVAGCSLFDGVILAADCRITYGRQDGSEVYVDNGLKVFAVTPEVALGYVGDVRVASKILRELFRQIRRRRRVGPVSLTAWLRRFFKSAYAKATGGRDSRRIAFMVASVLRGELNVVERAMVVELVKRIGFGQSPIRRHWMPGILIEILKTDPKFTHIRIPGTSYGLLYVMRSPEFAVEFYHPLQFVAVGSGEGAFQQIEKLHDMVVAGEPGNAFMESMWLRTAIEEFIEESGIKNVGGLFPMLKVKGSGIQALGMSAQVPFGGTQIELVSKPNGRWIQRNATTGKEIALVPPWEIPPTADADQVFDDLLEAYRAFRSPRPRSSC